MFKRVFDLTLSLVAAVVLAPLFVCVAALVWLKLGRPVLFRQKRPGLHGEPFYLVKFRSMTSDCDASGKLLPDDQRLGTFGRWLRSTSLDELPELWNVLVGSMSLVGPRPLLMEYLALYSPVQARRHKVRPGITGLAQVSGRNAISWDDKFKLDVWYVDNRTLLLDLKILVLTVVKVFRAEGISQPGEATSSPFRGPGS